MNVVIMVQLRLAKSKINNSFLYKMVVEIFRRNSLDLVLNGWYKKLYLVYNSEPSKNEIKKKFY